jgi:hypothetical protein
MLVGQHVTIRSYDYSRAGTAAGTSCLAGTADVDTDDRPTDMLYRAHNCL